MKTYYVSASYSIGMYALIKAANPDDALEIGRDMELLEFTNDSNFGGDLNIYDAEELSSRELARLLAEQKSEKETT